MKPPYLTLGGSSPETRVERGERYDESVLEGYSRARRLGLRARALLGSRRAVLPLLVVTTLVVLCYHSTQVSKPVVQQPAPLPQRPPASPYTETTSALSRNTTHPRPHAYSPFYGGPSTRAIDIASDPLPLDAPLSARLDAWAAAPGGILDDGVTPETYLRWNEEECSGLVHQSNNYEVELGGWLWDKQTREVVKAMRMGLVEYMRGYVGGEVLRQAEGLEGRGIVMLAGNADTLRRTVWSLKMLRSYKSRLPVRVYCFPEELPPPDDGIHAELAALGAQLEAVDGQHKDAKGKSYYLKAHAMLAAPWAEILYLDSDNVPVRDPEPMFSSPGYKRLGIWAAVDLWKTTAGHGIWAIMGVKCRNEWEMEAGAVYIDKRRHTDVLLLARRMLLDRSTWYYYSDGDKDIFRWAMLMLRKRWAVPGRWVGGGLMPQARPSGEACMVSMIPFDSYGAPLFIHMDIMKRMPFWFNVRQGNSWDRHVQLPLFEDWPPSPATARLGQPLTKPVEGDLPLPGDVDCDMLADADEFGIARAPAREEVRRRAARELGVQAYYHEGFCIGLKYLDPRGQERRAAEDEDVAAGRTWSSVWPDWSDPFEVVEWAHDPALWDFERRLYGFGFVPKLAE